MRRFLKKGKLHENSIPIAQIGLKLSSTFSFSFVVLVSNIGFLFRVTSDSATGFKMAISNFDLLRNPHEIVSYDLNV
jgi:hypothetical protein